jgi:hypothetical protein
LPTLGSGGAGPSAPYPRYYPRSSVQTIGKLDSFFSHQVRSRVKGQGCLLGYTWLLNSSGPCRTSREFSGSGCGRYRYHHFLVLHLHLVLGGLHQGLSVFPVGIFETDCPCTFYLTSHRVPRLLCLRKIPSLLQSRGLLLQVQWVSNTPSCFDGSIHSLEPCRVRA